jgi:hypothetical protein
MSLPLLMVQHLTTFVWGAVVSRSGSDGVSSAVNQGGLFNTANLNKLGWKVDGEAEMSAGGDR